MHPRTRLVDLVPLENRFYASLLGAGLLIVGLLEALYWLVPLVAPPEKFGLIAAFDLDGEGSLAAWVSSFTLTTAACTALVIYLLHLDEQGRRRRLWLWAAVCWLTMSIDESSSVHEAFKELMSHLTGHRILHDGTIWWVGAYFGVLSVTGLLLLHRLRVCRSAAASLLAVAALYGTAVLAELGIILPKDQYGVSLEEGCEMTADFCLLLSMALFLRYAARSHRRSPESRILQYTVRRAANDDSREPTPESAELPAERPAGVGRRSELGVTA